MLEYIKNNIFDLTADIFITDFEIAMRNSLKIKFPYAKFHLCWFHFCQALRRYCAQNGLLNEVIQKNATAKRIIYKFMALALLPASNI